MVLRRMQEVCAALEKLKQWLPAEIAVCEAVSCRTGGEWKESRYVNVLIGHISVLLSSSLHCDGQNLGACIEGFSAPHHQFRLF